MSTNFDLFFTEDSVLFKAIWRVLRREGWSSKPPPLRSLDCSFRYVKPGCNPDGVEGTDYFRGEQALVAYYRKQSVQLIQTDGNTVRLLPFRELPALSQERLARSGGYDKELECQYAVNNSVVVTDCGGEEENTIIGLLQNDNNVGVRVVSDPGNVALRSNRNQPNDNLLDEGTVAAACTDESTSRGRNNTEDCERRELRTVRTGDGATNSRQDIIVEEECADQSNSCEAVTFESRTSGSSNIQPSCDDRGRQNGANDGNEVGYGDRGEPPSNCNSNTVGSTDGGERRGPLNNAEVAEVGTADVDNTGTCTQLAHVDTSERGGPTSDVEGPEVGPARTSDTNIVEIAGCGDTIQPNPCIGGQAEQMGSQNRGGNDAPDRHAARGGHGSSRDHDGGGICSGRSSRRGDDGTDGRGSRGGRDEPGGQGIRGGRGDRGILSHYLDAEELCDRNSVDDTQRVIELISEPASSVAVVDLVTPPTLPQRHEVYVNSLVAFTPTKEKWLMTKKLEPVFRQVGTAYLAGRVCKRIIDKKTLLYEVRWLGNLFHKHTHSVNIGIRQRGIENYRVLTRSTSKPTWSALTATSDGEDFPPDVVLDDLVEVDGYTEFVPEQAIPTSLREAETIKNMKFDPLVQMKSPADLYSHSNGSTTTRVRQESVRLFTHSASSSFLAYVPLYFWRQIVSEVNAYAAVKNVKLLPAVTLSELMKFVGILFFMTINDKGEYANYWGVQPEDAMTKGNMQITGGCSLKTRYLPPTQRDPAARIRPLLNLLKSTGGMYVEVGRDVALDESSVACRSKFGRHCIVFNPMKPTGKYHFRLYMPCCATTWIAVNYRFHCNSDLLDRLDGVLPANQALELQQEWAESKLSSIRKLVLEVSRPLYGSNRIVNMDNYYTSVQLVQALRLRGLYARGTVRGTSKHFPKHTVLDKKEASRGDLRQGVCADHAIVAASWCDSNIVQ
ncbi:unnamed protein product [Phytophthora fragariaefolia]|uniref:Unnamed protein product n=1 Tax=Phytophthora fragariaefolia TaxID=1490495 RepID=A0A9W6XM12_9STRA|nr:unnamed protein product [Phytophthora fragariaefolia]